VTGISAVAGNGSATVSFTAPSNNGGSAITSYTVTSSGGQVVTGSASPITVTGLTNGTIYSFTVTAANSTGTSAVATSNSITPAIPATTSLTVPGTPTGVSAVAGNGSAMVSFIPPSNNGGSAITSYTVTSSGGQVATGSASPITVTGLTNGTIYSFTVTATNYYGSGVSVLSNSVTPLAPILTVPNAPNLYNVVAGDGAVTAYFNPPINDGGSPITSYTVTSSGGQFATGPASPITVAGLTNGVSYNFDVTGTNGIGTSATSVAYTIAPVGIMQSTTISSLPYAGTVVAGTSYSYFNVTTTSNDQALTLTPVAPLYTSYVILPTIYTDNTFSIQDLRYGCTPSPSTCTPVASTVPSGTVLFIRVDNGSGVNTTYSIN
jgi:hypothetical protein